MASSGWAQLRQQARSLESQTESLFHSFSQYAGPATVSPQPSEEELRVENQLKDLLERRESLLGQLARLLDSDPTLNSSSPKQNNLARHREVLLDHRRELNRLSASISEARNRANLLANVRSDISAYRSANPEDAEAEYMLEERRRVDSSNNMIDGVLSQAYAINENFGLQRETLASINRRIVSAAGTMPGINNLMTRIGAKKRRDGIILGSFIAFCFLMVFFFS